MFSILKILKEQNVTILLEHEVANIKQSKESFIINKEKYDIVISTTPNGFPDINLPSNFEYLGVICGVIKLKKQLTDYYWINVLEEEIPFKAVIEHTNFVKSRDHVAYTSHYLSREDRYWQMKDKEIIQQYMLYLEKLFPGISENIEDFRIFRSKYAQPIIKKDHCLNKNKLSKNLYSLNMTDVYPEDRGVNQAVREAKKLAERIYSEISVD
jgi:protoporphyrinogen oxidase